MPEIKLYVNLKNMLSGKENLLSLDEAINKLKSEEVDGNGK